ncbi:MAG: BrnT family toxin [Cytophagales bacterium]|nr:BrnT family toxin [Cytophagales bacterium]
MDYFSWNAEKNDWLKKERNISFEEVVFWITEGGLLDVVDHPNKEKYKNQRILIVEVNNYVYLVPFIENKNELFLKTIIPSRKATAKYLK